jgi:outer membrane protein assembly factor BamD (BamD/ComL family)
MNTRYHIVLFFLLVVPLCAYTEVTPVSEETVVTIVPAEEPLPKKRRRSRKPGSVSSFIVSPHLNIKSMTYEQLAARVPELIVEGNLRGAGKYLKRMVTLSTDPDLCADHEIQIADLLFQRGKYEKAATRFRLFSVLYGGNKKHAEYAEWRACESFSKCLNSLDRCQEQTHTTIRIADAYLARALFTTYRDEVQKIRTSCYELLVQSEMHIWSYCVKSNNTNGAEVHLAYVENDLAKAYPPAFLLAQAYKQTGSFEDLSMARADSLLAAGPGGADTVLATERAAQRPRMADRF